MFYYTYKLIHKETNEFYFGSRECKNNPINDNYLGSMCVWKPDKNKLSKYILNLYKNRKEALIEEAKLIKNHIKDPLNRNYHIPNIDFNFYKRTSKKWLIETYGENKGLERYNQICKKISKIHKNKPKSKKHKEKLSIIGKTRRNSIEVRNKISDGLKLAYAENRKKRPDYKGEKHPMFGKNHTKETKRKISENQKGKTATLDTKLKMSNSHKGKKLSNETKQKMRKPKSKEAIENMKIAQRLRREKEKN